MLVSNLATNFGTRAESVELGLAFIAMISGIIITHLIQRWADKTSGEHPAAANIGKGGTDQYQQRSMRE